METVSAWVLSSVTRSGRLFCGVFRDRSAAVGMLCTQACGTLTERDMDVREINMYGGFADGCPDEAGT